MSDADHDAPDPEKVARIETLKAKVESEADLTEDEEAFLDEVAADPRYAVTKVEED